MASEAAAPEIQTKDALRLIPFEKLQESKTNPRKNFDKKKLETLAASIREKNLLQAILVRPQNGHFEIVCGARRYRACKMAGLREVLCQVRGLSDDQALEAQVIENGERQNVHELEEAEGYRALIQSGRYTVETIADRIGKSASHVYMRLKLTELIEPVKQAFVHETITARHAETIARHTPEIQKEALEFLMRRVDVGEGDPDEWGHKEKIIKVAVSTRDLQVWFDNNVNRDLSKMPWDMEDATLLPKEKATSCMACPKRTGNTPALFPDIQKETTCSDRHCFTEKFNAWIDRRIKELKVQGVKAIVISEEQYNWRLAAIEGRQGVKRKGEYHAIGKQKCRNAGVGIHWDGKSRGGETEICTAATCGKHNPKPSYSRPSGSSGSSSSKPKTPAQILKEKRAEEERGRKAEREGQQQQAVFAAALEKAPARPGLRDLQGLGVYLSSGDMPGELREIFPQFKGWGNKTRQVMKLKEKDLLKLLYGFSISEWDEVNEKALEAACKRWKVPVDQVTADLKKKWDAEDAARKAKEAVQDSAGSAKDTNATPRKIVNEVLGRAINKSKAKFDEPTCVRCICTEDAACPEIDGGCSWVILDKRTNHGVCSSCVKPEELAEIRQRNQKK